MSRAYTDLSRRGAALLCRERRNGPGEPAGDGEEEEEGEEERDTAGRRGRVLGMAAM